MMLFTAGNSTRTAACTRGMASTALFVICLVTLLPSQGVERIDVTSSSNRSIIEQQPEVSLYSPRFEKM